MSLSPNELDPSENTAIVNDSLQLKRNEHQVLMNWAGEWCVLSAQSAFPLSAPLEMIYLYVTNDQEKKVCVGYLENIQSLSAENKQLIMDVMTQGNILPRITKILDLKDEYYSFHFFVETDRGKKDFYFGAPRKHIVKISENRLLIHDLQNDYYFIEDLKSLDHQSLEFLKLVD